MGENEESSGTTSWRILCTEVERKSWNNTKIHFAGTRITRKEELFEWTLENSTKWSRILVENCHTFPVNQQGFQVRDLCSAATNACNLKHGFHLDYRKTFWHIHARRSSHYTHSIEEFIHLCSTGKPVARKEERTGSTIPMPTFARRPPTMSSFVPVDIPQSSVVGQQRQQISELQFDTFPTPQSFYVGK